MSFKDRPNFCIWCEFQGCTCPLSRPEKCPLTWYEKLEKLVRDKVKEIEDFYHEYSNPEVLRRDKLYRFLKKDLLGEKI